MKTNPLLIILSLVTILFTQQAFTQSWGYKQANSLDIYIGGDIGYRLLSDQSNVSNEIVENRNTYESFKTNYKVGLNYNIGINESLSIRTGIRYQNSGYGVSRVDKVEFSENFLPVQFSSNPKGYTYKTTYHIAGLPLGLRYVLSKRSCDPYIEFGLVPSLYLGTKITEFNYEGNKTANYSLDEDLNSFNLFSYVSIGGNFTITENISGFTQLTANYQLDNLRKNPISEKIVSLGIELGLRTHF